MDKSYLSEKAYNLGFEYEKKYKGCSQCTIAAVQDTIGIRNDYIFKAGSGLAGGCGLLRDGVCGGYSGGIMIMSTFFGRGKDKFDDDRNDKHCSYHMAIALHDLFIETYGSIICKDIHHKIFGRSYDLWDPEDKKAFEKAGAHADKCTGVVANASKWTLGLIVDEIEKRGLSINDFENLIFKFM